MRTERRLLLTAVLLAALIWAARHYGLGARFEELQAWIKTLGFWGPAVYVLVYAAGTVIAFPGSVLTVAAGSLFGSLTGFFTVSAGSTLGAALAFLAARYAARGYVENRLKDNDKFQKLDLLTARHGNIIVAVTRLVPLFPFTLLNYAFGLTKINFWVYVGWSWLCMIPGTILYVAGGDAVTRLIKEGRAPAPLLALLAAALVIMTLLARHFGRLIKDDKPGEKK